MSAIATVLCGDAAVSRELEGSAEQGLTIVPGLCGQLERITDVIAGADGLVLATCGPVDLGAVQRAARRGGLDALGVELVDLRSSQSDAGRLSVILAGAAARAGAFVSTTAQPKLVFPRQSSRRSLLTFSLPEYHAAPGFATDRCSGADGCRLCIDACPRGALTWTGRAVDHDLASCDLCGTCITACPTGAVVNPAATPTQLAAQVRALLGSVPDASEARGILFRCLESNAVDDEAGWFSVTVPCTGMVASGWLLAVLAMGAGTVAARPCSEGGCPHGADERVVAHVAWCRRLLAGLGLDPGIVRLAAEGPIEAPLVRAGLDDPFGPFGLSDAVLALAAAQESPDLVFEDDGAPLGVVHIRADVCSGCEACAEKCPSGALISSRSDEELTIAFDAARCTACRVCVETCVEKERGAIEMTRAVDVGALRRGRQVLMRDHLARCESCGGPVAPAGMLDRIAELLGDDDPGILGSIGQRCSTCRALAAQPR